MSETSFIRHASLTNEGDSVEVKRLFPIAEYMNFDPFVLWDHFDVQPGSGFPDHPHRGFEAITYMFEGSMKHTDNLGNDSRVGAGGAQRFTAGKGIVHSEMPGTQGSNTGIQLWINLPHRLKGLEPDYQEVLAENIPEINFDGGRVRTIVGEDSRLKLHTQVEYEDITLQPAAHWKKTVAEGLRGFVYVVDGSLQVNDRRLDRADALFMQDADSINVMSETASRFMVCLGHPHGEPIRQWGPYVD